MGYVHLTFYGYPGNNPPSADTAYNCGGRNNTAGGTGTYSDPVTFGSAEGEFNECQIVYIPCLEKYARCKSFILLWQVAMKMQNPESGAGNYLTGCDKRERVRWLTRNDDR